MPTNDLHALWEAAKWLSEVHQAYAHNFPGLLGLWRMYEHELTPVQRREAENRDNAMIELNDMQDIAWKELDALLNAIGDSTLMSAYKSAHVRWLESRLSAYESPNGLPHKCDKCLANSKTDSDKTQKLRAVQQAAKELINRHLTRRYCRWCDAFFHVKSGPVFTDGHQDWCELHKLQKALEELEKE